MALISDDDYFYYTEVVERIPFIQSTTKESVAIESGSIATSDIIHLELAVTQNEEYMPTVMHYFPHPRSSPKLIDIALASSRAIVHDRCTVA